MADRRSQDEASYSGRFLLRERLGSGGMAEVFLAEMKGQDGFRKLVALKRIHSHLMDDEDFVSSFISEARLGGSLNHPNIVQTLDLGRDGDNYYLAMEYVQGLTLLQLLRHRQRTRAPLPLPVVLDIGRQLCDALAYAHSATDPGGVPLRMVHRDLKPENILLSLFGVVKITDFGVAKAASNVRHTASLMVKGTVAYMSPEQAASDVLDHRSDLYALGAILFELLTLEPLYPEAHGLPGLFLVQKSQLEHRLTLLETQPPELVQTIERLLARERDERPGSAAEVKRALMSIAARLPASAQDLEEVVREANEARAALRLPASSRESISASDANPISLSLNQKARGAPEVGASNASSSSLSREAAFLSAPSSEAILARPESGQDEKPRPTAELMVSALAGEEKRPETEELGLRSNSGAARQGSSAPAGVTGGGWGQGSSAELELRGASSSEGVAGPGSDAVAGPGSDAVARPGSDAVAGPGSDAVAGPGSDAVARPGSDAVAGPGSDAVARPGPDAGTGPASDAVARPGSEPVRAGSGGAAVESTVHRTPSRRGIYLAVGALATVALAGLFLTSRPDGSRSPADREETLGTEVAAGATRPAETGVAPGAATATGAEAAAGAAQPSGTEAAAGTAQPSGTEAAAGAARPIGADAAAGTEVAAGPAKSTDGGTAGKANPPGAAPGRGIELPSGGQDMPQASSKPSPTRPRATAMPNAHATPPGQPATPSTSRPAPPAAPSAAASRVAPDATGFLTVNAVPYAYVFVDGQKLAETTPVTYLELPAGRHKLVFKAEDGRTKTQQADIKPGQHLKLETVRFE